MREVALTVGPQGAGKTTFCERALALDPSFKMVSRDAILIELFGSAWLNPYTDQHSVGQKLMWEKVQEHLQHPPETHLILDTWNGHHQARRNINEKLRSMGADRIEAWYFVTDLDTCTKWLLEREPPKDAFWESIKRNSCERNFKRYHSEAVELEQGFDAIVCINPLERGPEHVLKLQTTLSFD